MTIHKIALCAVLCSPLFSPLFADEVQTNHYPNGQIKNEAHFVDGISHGMTKHWYKNGQTSMEVMYDHGQVVSTVSYYPEGQMRMRETLDDVTGILTTEAWYTTGEVSHRFQAKKGRKEGTLVKYAPTGLKVAEVSYRDGVNDGWCRIWGERDVLETELYYEKGRLDRQRSTKGDVCRVDIWRFGFR